MRRAASHAERAFPLPRKPDFGPPPPILAAQTDDRPSSLAARPSQPGQRRRYPQKAEAKRQSHQRSPGARATIHPQKIPRISPTITSEG